MVASLQASPRTVVRLVLVFLLSLRLQDRQAEKALSLSLYRNHLQNRLYNHHLLPWGMIIPVQAV
jgi:hypothetical protein